MSVDPTGAFERVTGTLQDDPNLIATLDVVDTLNVMVEGAHPILRCPSGCARCCLQQVFISEEEWAILLPALHRDSTADERRRGDNRMRVKHELYVSGAFRRRDDHRQRRDV